MSHPALTIVSLYNRYLNRGGEDEVFEAEAELLAAHGHRVIRVEEHVREPAGWRARWQLARNAVWSNDWHEKIRQLLQQNRPDIVHIHNWWPQMSPAVCYAAHSARYRWSTRSTIIGSSARTRFSSGMGMSAKIVWTRQSHGRAYSMLVIRARAPEPPSLRPCWHGTGNARRGANRWTCTLCFPSLRGGSSLKADCRPSELW